MRQISVFSILFLSLVGFAQNPEVHKPEHVIGLGALQGFSYSPDGKSIFSYGPRGVVQWSLATKSVIRRFAEQKSRISSIAFSPKGGTFAAGSYDHTVQIWNISSGKSIAVLKGHIRSISALGFSRDGSKIVSGSDDGQIRFWDTKDFRPLGVVKDHSKAIEGLAFSPNGKLLASTSSDGLIRIWDLKSRRNTAKFGEKNFRLYSLKFSRDGAKLFSGTEGGLLIWNVAKQKVEYKLTTHGRRYPTSRIEVSPDGKQLATSDRQRITIFDLSTGTPEYNVSLPSGGWDISFSPTRKELALAFNDHRIELFDYNRTSLGRLEGHLAPVGKITYSPDGKLLAYSSSSKIYLLQTTSYQPIATLEGHTADVSGLKFSLDSQFLYSAGRDGLLLKWDVSNHELVQLKTVGKEIYALDLSPISSTLATITDDMVQTWTALDFQPIKEYSATLMFFFGLADLKFSPSEEVLLASSGFGLVGWDVETTNQTANVRGAFETFSYHPQGSYLASGGNFVLGADKEVVTLWDFTTEETTEISLKEHSGGIAALEFSPDGVLLFSASLDQSIRIWDVATRNSLAKLEGHRDAVRSLAISPDGKYIASGSDDGTVHIWRVWS